MSDFFEGIWLAHQQVRLRANKLRVSDFVFEVVLTEDRVRFRGDDLRVNWSFRGSTMASRQARLRAAIVRASGLFLDHPKAPPLEVDGGDNVGGVRWR
jgi:hypothetical protein